MATLGKWSGGAIGSLAVPEAWAAPNGLFPTEDRNDSSAYSFTSSTSTVTLPSSGLADGYLLVAAFEYNDSSNGRFNPQGKIVQASGTGTFVGGPTGGFLRDSSEDRAYVRTWAFVDGPSASGTYQFQWKADTDDAGATDGTERSEFWVIPLYYADIGLYSSTDHTLMGGTTPNVVPGWSGTDGANITLSSNVVSVTGDNKRYLVLGSQFFEGRGGRTQRWHGLDIDGAQENAAKAYSYYRNSANDESGDMFTWLLETATSTITIEQTCYRGDGVSNNQGGADVDGSDPGVGDHALVVIELNDSAEVFHSSSNAASSNLATTGPVDLSPFPSANFSSDTDSFTRVSDSAVNAEKAMDALVGANVAGASGIVTTGARWTAYSELTIDGVEQTDTFAGDYLRNNQTSTDTFGWSANLLSPLALSANEDIGVSVTELPGTEGGGGNVASPAGWTGIWGVNLDTLEGGVSAVSIESADADHNHTADAISLGVTRSLGSSDATHAHTADSVSLLISRPLGASDAGHAHTADGVSLGITKGVEISHAVHGHTADGVSLAVTRSLSIADGDHAQTADAVTLGVERTFETASCVHNHSVDAVSLGFTRNIGVSDTDHAHTADNVDLGTINNVGSSDAFHDHTASAVYLDVIRDLEVGSAEHNHTVDGVTISFGAIIADAAKYRLNAGESVGSDIIGADKLGKQLVSRDSDDKIGQ